MLNGNAEWLWNPFAKRLRQSSGNIRANSRLMLTYIIDVHIRVQLLVDYFFVHLEKYVRKINMSEIGQYFSKSFE